MVERIPEPELMEDTVQCNNYNQSLLNNSNALLKFVQAYTQYIGITNGTIVDLGSGTANFIIELCKTYPNLKVVCYENSNAMIKIAQDNINNEKLQNRITIINDNFFNATGTFDAVIANRVLHHVNDTEKFWQLINNLSKDVLVCDLERPKKLEYIGSWFDVDVKNSFKAAYTANEVRSQITPYGYSVVKEEIGNSLFALTVYQNKKSVSSLTTP